MAATSGVVTIDVGVFPGVDMYTTTVAATGCTGAPQVEAWIIPYTTADHSLDEHLVDPPRVMAHSPNNGVGFSVTLLPREARLEATPQRVLSGKPEPRVSRSRKGINNIYGTWRVGWVHS